MAPRFFAPRSSDFANRFEYMPKELTAGAIVREPTELEQAALEQPTFMGEFWAGPAANRPRARREMFAAEIQRRKHILTWIRDAEREVVGDSSAKARATPDDNAALQSHRTLAAVDLQPRKSYERTHQAIDRVLRPRVRAQDPAPKARAVSCHLRHSTVRFAAPPGKLAVVVVRPTRAKSAPSRPGDCRAPVSEGCAQRRRAR